MDSKLGEMIVLAAISLSSPGLARDTEPPQNYCDASISVAASMNERDKYVLRFVIKNEGRTPVSIYKSDLPWGSNTSTTLVVISAARAAEPIRGVYYPDDPSIDSVTIDPGKSMEGLLDLESVYPSLRHQMTRHGLIVFWSHQPKSEDQKKYCRSGGFQSVMK